MDFEAPFEKIFKQWSYLVFPSSVGIFVVSNFGNLEILLILLWKLAELLLFAKCWWPNKVWSASIVAGVLSLRNWGWLAVPFLLSWRCSGGTLCDFLVKSCHNVVAYIWARVSRRPVFEEACFRMRMTMGVVLSCSLAGTEFASWRLRSGSGVALN